MNLLVNEIQDAWLQITDTYDIFSEIETPASCEQTLAKLNEYSLICRDPLSSVVLNSRPLSAFDEDLAGALTVKNGKGLRYSFACLFMGIDVHNGLVPERVPRGLEPPKDTVAPDPLRQIRWHGAGRLA